MRNLLTLYDYAIEDINDLILLAYSRKHGRTYGMFVEKPNSKAGKTLTLMFEKNSTRTRLSCSVAWQKLGGNVIDMSPSAGSHVGGGETIHDSAKVISSVSDCIIARVKRHRTLKLMENALSDKCILVNGLCDKYHPLQSLADVMTMYEHSLSALDWDLTDADVPLPPVKQVLKGKRVCWIGDANNVLNSLITTLPKFGMYLSIATPKKYPVNPEILQKIPYLERGYVSLGNDPTSALKDANYIITDTWISMGDEDEKAERLSAFSGFRVTKRLIRESRAAKDWAFLHCLPRKSEEVSDAVFYCDQSLVFTEAENRMWTAMSVFELLIEN